MADREERFRRAHAVAAEAVTVPPEERAAFVASHPDCQCNEFAELMIGMARELRDESPRDSIRCAHLAVTAVEAYVEVGGQDGENIRALAWAELGNDHRILGDLRAAGLAFDRARELVRHASDPLVQAEAYSLEASYWDYMWEFQRADRLLKRAERLQRRFGTGTELAKILIQRAEPARATGRFQDAINLLESALRMLEIRENPRLALFGVHNLARCLIDAGASAFALTLLEKFGPVYRAFADPRTETKRGWMQGRALLQLGRISEAKPFLEGSKSRFAELESPYDTAWVTLDLTELYAAEGNWDSVEESAAETVQICRAHGVRAEALAAARLLLAATARRQASLDTVASLATAVRRHLAPAVRPHA